MESSKRWVRIVLGILQIFIGIGAIPAGLTMIIDPTAQGIGMSTDMLAGSPFPNFLIPGIVLFTVNGLGSLIGAFLTFKRHAFASLSAMGLGVFLMAWVVIQVSILGLPIHWLQWLYFFLGLMELVLGWLLNPAAMRSLLKRR
jgi:hypothetical protein